MTAAERDLEPSDDDEERPRKQSGSRRRATLAFGAQRAIVVVAHADHQAARAIAGELSALDYATFIVASADEAIAQASVLRPHAFVCSEALPGLEEAVEMRHAIGEAVGDPRRTAVIFVGGAGRRGVIAEGDATVVAEAVRASVQRRQDAG